MEGRRAIRARNISKKFTCSSQLLPRFTDHEKFGVTRGEENIIFQWHGRSELLPFVPWRGILVYKGNENYSREPSPAAKQTRNNLVARSWVVAIPCMQLGFPGKGRVRFQTKFQARWEFQEECSSILENENASREKGKIIDKFFQSKLEQNLIRDGVQCIPRDIFRSMLTIW